MNQPSPSLNLSAVQLKGGFLYTKPKPADFIRHIPSNIAEFGRIVIKKESALPLALVAAGTLILIPNDQRLVDEANALGDRLKISHAGRQNDLIKTGISIGNKEINFQGPSDRGTWLYFLGDGWLHLGFAGGFLIYGLGASDNRALRTASQIPEGILSSGIIVQLLKRTTGRETPNAGTKPGGRWRPFPNPKDYQKNVSRYDAFVSGHMASAMATVTVIAENYPEYGFIRPIGYSLMGLLGYQMLNNGVHWASDYPLPLWMGYSFGKIITRRGRSRASSVSAPVEIAPALLAKDALGLRLKIQF